MKMEKWHGFGVIALTVLLFLVLIGIAYAPKDELRQLGLPVLAITGVVLLLAALALVSICFSMFDLSDKGQALALPEGSIRAVIALMLIVLFAISTIYVYGSMSNPEKMERIQKVSESAVAQFPKELFVTAVIVQEAPEKLYDLYYRVPQNRDSIEFAKQLLVMLGTLVSSIASFYFGTKAATAGTARSIKIPNLIAADPIGSSILPMEIRLHGANLDLVNDVKLYAGLDQIILTDVVSNSSLVLGKIRIKPENEGPWDVVATDSGGRSSRLAAALSFPKT
jgi:hypothetical protein